MLAQYPTSGPPFLRGDCVLQSTCLKACPSFSSRYGSATREQTNFCIGDQLLCRGLFAAKQRANTVLGFLSEGYGLRGGGRYLANDVEKFGFLVATPTMHGLAGIALAACVFNHIGTIRVNDGRSAFRIELLELKGRILRISLTRQQCLIPDSLECIHCIFSR